MGMCREEFAAFVVERLREGPEAVDGKGRSSIVVVARTSLGERAFVAAGSVATKKNLPYIEESLCPPVSDLRC